MRREQRIEHCCPSSSAKASGPKRMRRKFWGWDPGARRGMGKCALLSRPLPVLHPHASSLRAVSDLKTPDPRCCRLHPPLLPSTEQLPQNFLPFRRGGLVRFRQRLLASACPPMLWCPAAIISRRVSNSVFASRRRRRGRLLLLIASTLRMRCTPVFDLRRKDFARPPLLLCIEHNLTFPDCRPALGISGRRGLVFRATSRDARVGCVRGFGGPGRGPKRVNLHARRRPNPSPRFHHRAPRRPSHPPPLSARSFGLARNFLHEHPNFAHALCGADQRIGVSSASGNASPGLSASRRVGHCRRRAAVALRQRVERMRCWRAPPEAQAVIEIVLRASTIRLELHLRSGADGGGHVLSACWKKTNKKKAATPAVRRRVGAARATFSVPAGDFRGRSGRLRACRRGLELVEAAHFLRSQMAIIGAPTAGKRAHPPPPARGGLPWVMSPAADRLRPLRAETTEPEDRPTQAN